MTDREGMVVMLGLMWMLTSFVILSVFLTPDLSVNVHPAVAIAIVLAGPPLIAIAMIVLGTVAVTAFEHAGVKFE